MKKSILKLLIISCIFLMGSKFEDKNMLVKVGEVTPPIYNIEISWDSMEFIYQETINYIWDNNTKSYELVDPTYKWNTVNNNINIKNKSNIIVNIELKYISDYENVEGNFDISKTIIKQNENVTSKLTLDGELSSNNSDYVNVGTINLVIS